jgi:heme oxygenase
MPTEMMPLLANLKEKTMPYHKNLEQKLDLFKPGFSRTDYLQLLKRFWGYYLPLETKLTHIPELIAWLPDLNHRAKLPLLESDLINLGIPPDYLKLLPLCADLPTFKEPAAALGCLYVLEGSTLGGQMISRHLKQSLDLDKNSGVAFFIGYAESTGSMWQLFRESLNAAQVDQEIVIQAACETFLTLERWLCPTYSLTEKLDVHVS